MIKKVIQTLFCMCLAMVLLSGCVKVDESFEVGADGALKLHTEVWYEKQKMLEAIQEMSKEIGETPSGVEIDAMMLMMGFKLDKKDGKNYYVMSPDDAMQEQVASLKENYQSLSPETKSNTFVSLTETSFEAVIATDMKSLEEIYSGFQGMGSNAENGLEIDDAYEMMQKYLKDSEMYISVTFATPIAEVAGGVLSEDKKTVFFSISMDEESKKISAYCENDIPFDGVKSGILYGRKVSYTIPEGVTATLNGSKVKGTVSSEKSGKYELRLKASDGTQKSIYYGVDTEGPAFSGIKKNGIYAASKKITISDTGEIDTVTVDGKDIFAELEPVIEGVESLNNLKYIYTLNNLKDGKHTLVATDTLGNKSSVTFQVDKTAPKVTGVKNNKTYKKAVTIKVSDKNGVKSITLNGKKIKNKKKVTKAGSYTVIAKDKVGNKKTIKFKIKK